MLEYVQTVPTFWDATKDFIEKNPHYPAKDNSMGFLSNDGGRSYNLCHCKCTYLFLAPVSRGINNPELYAVWSNFEIADMNLWRGEIYTKYFEHLEASGGFYYEASAYT